MHILHIGPSLTDDTARPRLLTFLPVLLGFVIAVVYFVPLITTGDPLWPLPAATEADRLVLYWDGSRTELNRQDQRYSKVMGALNATLSSPEGIEYRYGISGEDVDRIRAGGRALEAIYVQPTRAHGAYATGEFTRVLVSFAGDEYDRRLVFFGGANAYRAGPVRARDLAPLRDAVAASR